jgi:hypothetical protein
MFNANISRQMVIWESQCSDCQVWNSCGGAKTAPCGCIYTDKRRFDCINCTIQCKERYVVLSNTPVDSFSNNVASTMSLEELQINQNFFEKNFFPWFIPTQTRQLPVNAQLDWAGVCLADLVTDRKTPPIKIKKYLTTPLKSREFLRMKINGNLIAVMNALDKPLEHFWASNRGEFYNALKTNGFSMATGPTFSVYSRLSSKSYIPDSHSVLMLRRQNKILQELYDNDIIPIPNIYWRNNRDQDAWVSWLSKNNSIHVISRDFSSTKRGSEYEIAINQLIDIIKKVDRKFHVFLNGIGLAKAAEALKLFARIGCTCSFLTSHPVMLGRNGMALLPQGIEKPMIIKRPDLPFADLALQNIDVTRNHLLEVASSCF